VRNSFNYADAKVAATCTCIKANCAQ